MSEETVDDSVEVVAEGVSEDTPAIAHDEYLESILELKAQKSDVLEFVTVAQQYASQLDQANQRLGMLNEALTENTNALQDRMKELIEPLGVSGEFTITDSEPHYVVAS